MVGTNSVKLMRSRAIVASTASGSKPFSMCTVPPRISVGSTFVFAVLAQRALGLAGRAAGGIQRGEIVETCQTLRARMSCALDRRQEIDAVTGRSHGEDRFQQS